MLTLLGCRCGLVSSPAYSVSQKTSYCKLVGERSFFRAGVAGRIVSARLLGTGKRLGVLETDRVDSAPGTEGLD